MNDEEYAWTRELPEEEGWYWVEMPSGDSIGVTIRKVEARNQCDFLSVFIPIRKGWYALDNPALVNWRWAGPIPEPRDNNQTNHPSEQRDET